VAVGPGRSSDRLTIRVPRHFDQLPDRGLAASRNRETYMQKAHLNETILLVNQGVDEAVRGLEPLERSEDSQLNSACFDEELVLFEDHRARLNSYFCSALQRAEQQDSIRFEARYREYEKDTLDEVQVYRDLRAVEKRQRVEGKPPKVRFFTQ
jgi:hypothetical protein